MWLLILGYPWNERASGSSFLNFVIAFEPSGTCYAQLRKKASAAVMLTLAYQSFGVVYGDLSVSPLYVFHATFSKIQAVDPIEEYEVYGVLSFVFWTLTLIPLAKYCLIVLNAHDNGEGTPYPTLLFTYFHGFFFGNLEN